MSLTKFHTRIGKDLVDNTTTKLNSKGQIEAIGFNNITPDMLSECGPSWDTNGDLKVCGNLFVGTDAIVNDEIYSGGEIALTLNDSGGNANIAFNHAGQIPDKDGHAGRITVNVDADDQNSVAKMTFAVKSNVTAGDYVDLYTDEAASLILYEDKITLNRSTLISSSDITDDADSIVNKGYVDEKVDEKIKGSTNRVLNGDFSLFNISAGNFWETYTSNDRNDDLVNDGKVTREKFTAEEKSEYGFTTEGYLKLQINDLAVDSASLLTDYTNESLTLFNSNLTKTPLEYMGKDVTVSFWAKASQETRIVNETQVHIPYDNGGEKLVTSWTPTITKLETVGTKWQKFTFTYRHPTFQEVIDASYIPDDLSIDGTFDKSQYTDLIDDFNVNNAKLDQLYSQVDVKFAWTKGGWIAHGNDWGDTPRPAGFEGTQLTEAQFNSFADSLIDNGWYAIAEVQFEVSDTASEFSRSDSIDSSAFLTKQRTDGRSVAVLSSSSFETNDCDVVLVLESHGIGESQISFRSNSTDRTNQDGDFGKTNAAITMVNNAASSSTPNQSGYDRDWRFTTYETNVPYRFRQTVLKSELEIDENTVNDSEVIDRLRLDQTCIFDYQNDRIGYGSDNKLDNYGTTTDTSNVRNYNVIINASPNRVKLPGSDNSINDTGQDDTYDHGGLLIGVCDANADEYAIMCFNQVPAQNVYDKGKAGELFAVKSNGDTVVYGNTTLNKKLYIPNSHVYFNQTESQRPGLSSASPDNTVGGSYEYLGDGGGAFHSSRENGVAYFANRNSNGNIMEFRKEYTRVGWIEVDGNTTKFESNSDHRLKEDITDITDAVDKLKKLKPVNFRWISDGTRVDGFIAHEAQEVVPNAVSGTKDAVDEDGNPDYQGIDHSKIVPLLTKALQDAISKIEVLEERIAKLES